MKRNYLLLFFVLISLFSNGQKVKMIKMNTDYFRHADVSGFIYLHEKAEKKTYEWIADVRINFDTIRKGGLKELFEKIKRKSNKFGANAFRVLQSDIVSYADKKFIELGVFYLKWEDRDANLDLFRARKIHLFGFLSYHQKIKGYKVKVNGNKYLLEELSYKLFQPTVGKKMTIKIGKGIKQQRVAFTVKKNMVPKYYKFKIFKGMFTKALIIEYNWSYGEFLTRILRKEIESL